MTTDARVSYPDLRERLRQRLLDRRDGVGSVLHIPVEAKEAIDLLGWLSAQSSPQRLCIGPIVMGRIERAMVGVSDMVSVGDTADANTVLQTVHERCEAHGFGEMSYFGGLGWPGAECADEDWASLGSGCFVLPRFEFAREGSQFRFTVWMPEGYDDQVLVAFDHLNFETEPVPALPKLESRSEDPDQAAWSERVQFALDAITQKKLNKVVLARKATLTFEDELDGLHLLRRLKKATPGCFHFYVQLEQGTSFIGASPERFMLPGRPENLYGVDCRHAPARVQQNWKMSP